jgi:hypothetical protein
MAPVSIPIGMHFESYDDFIFTPIIKESLIKLDTNDKGHYTVYLPTYDIEHIMGQVFKIKSTKTMNNILSIKYNPPVSGTKFRCNFLILSGLS